MTDKPNNIVALESAEEIEAQAASWLTTLGRDEVTDTDRKKFQTWLAQSERHRRAFNNLSAMWDDLAILKDLNDIAEATPSNNGIPFGLHRRTFMAAAASLGVMTIGGAFFTYMRRTSVQSGAYATAIGEQKMINLADGSTVQLNTDSRVEVALTKTHRVIQLTKGEAHFVVAKHKHRPFLVQAAGGVVTAVGTAFTVRVRANKALEVTVEEGRVTLGAAAEEAIASPMRTELAELTAGQNAIFTEKIDQLAQMAASEINRKLSWRQGLLAYSGEPLSEVIDDISRYTELHIEISDPALRSLPVGGYFSVGEVDALFDSLEVTFGLKIERMDEGYVRLSSRES